MPVCMPLYMKYFYIDAVYEPHQQAEYHISFL